MTKYIHKGTRATIDVASVITGDAWELLDELHRPEIETAKEVEKPVEETEDQVVPENFDITKMTVKELKQYAKANEIDLPSDAKKEEIVEVIANAFV